MPWTQRPEPWTQRGSVHLWQCDCKDRRRSGAEYHLTADPDGCDSLLELLQILRRHGSGDRVVAVSPPIPAMTRMVTHNCLHPMPYRTWRVSLDPPSKQNFDLVQMDVAGEEVRTNYGLHVFSDLVAGIRDIKKGDGDWSIASPVGVRPEFALWFWWHPGPHPKGSR